MCLHVCLCVRMGKKGIVCVCVHVCVFENFFVWVCIYVCVWWHVCIGARGLCWCMCACAWQSECVDVSVCLRVYFSIFSHEYTMICLLWRVCIWHVCVSARMKNRKRASVCLSACLCVCVYLCAFLRTSIFSCVPAVKYVLFQKKKSLYNHFFLCCSLSSFHTLS